MVSSKKNIEFLPRKSIGKTSIKALKKDGMVPAILYVKHQDSIPYQISADSAIDLISDCYAMTKMHTVLDQNQKEINVIIKDIQFHPVTDKPVHFDFILCKKGDQFTVPVPVRFINKDKSVGIRRGGEIVTLQYNVLLKVKISEKPLEVHVDATDSIIGTKFYLSDAKLPEGSSIVKNDLVARLVGKRVKAVVETEVEDKEGDKDKKVVEKK